MAATVSAVILVLAFAAIAVLAALLSVAAFRRAGAREATQATGERLSLPHGFRARQFRVQARRGGTRAV